MSVTIIIIIITVLVSLSANSNITLYTKLLYNPYKVYHNKEWYRLFTHAFIHDKDNIFHLIVNMYVLYIFGRATENYFIAIIGTTKAIYFYFLLYIGGVFFATLPSMSRHKNNYLYNSVGASGAVSAVLFSAIIFNPTTGIVFIFLPFFHIPAFLFGILYLAYEIYMDKRSKDYIAHDAHIWGALFGIIFTFTAIPGAFVNFINQITYFVN
ncbi:MAG: rhomboid family intramembrane serine protease [Vicingaceae bacterium]